MKKLITIAIMITVVMLLTGCYTKDGRLSFGTKKNDTKPAVTAQPAVAAQQEENQTNSKTTGDEKMTNPVVTITLENDMIINIELFPEKAPNTVDNFISLVQDGYYDGVIFHRIIDGFMIQGGDPDGTGMGGPGYGIEGEFSQNGFKQNDIKHTPGVISMARSASPNSGGSQFFLMVADSPHLDGAYAAFGKTADEQSLKNCLELGKAEVSGDKPLDPPVMKTVTVDTKGVEYKEPKHA